MDDTATTRNRGWLLGKHGDDAPIDDQLALVIAWSIAPTSQALTVGRAHASWTRSLAVRMGAVKTSVHPGTRQLKTRPGRWRSRLRMRLAARARFV